MGRFENKNYDGVATYDVFSKKTFAEVYSLDRLMTLYSFDPDGVSKTREIYYDTPANLLGRAGLTLCKVIEKDSAYFRVERQNYIPLLSLTKVKDEKMFIEDINENDTVKDHMFYLIDGITSMFSTSFNIDLENVLKTIVPKVEIITKATVIKAFSGNGFKARMDFEDVQFKNYETKRTVMKLMMNVKMTSSITHLATFEDFRSKLEKYCKSIIPIKDSKYQLATRLTKPIVFQEKDKKAKK